MHPEYPEYRPPSQRDLDRASLRRILFASVIGTTIEFFEYQLPDLAALLRWGCWTGSNVLMERYLEF